MLPMRGGVRLALGRLLAVAIATVALGLPGTAGASGEAGATKAAAGGMIVFRSSRDGTYPYALHSINLDGTGLRQLSNDLVAPAWTRNAGKLAFIMLREKRRDLAIQGSGGPVRVLDTDGNVGTFAWSPGGRRIAYDGYDSASSVITIVDVVSGARRTVGAGKWPQWSPDGKRLAFQRPDPRRSFFSQLVVVNSDGTHPKILSGDVSSGEFAWSPDGKRIAYVQSERLWVVKRDGTSPVQIAPWLLHIDDMSWSPDGKQIVYESRDGQSPSGGYILSVFVVRVDVTGWHRLFKDISNAQPAWSPRGGEIAVSFNLGRLKGVYLVHPDGKGRRKVLGESAVSPPLWSPDGRFVTVGAGDFADVWVVDSRTRRARRLTEGWRYGYGNRPLRWLPAGLSGVLLPGNPVQPTMTTDSVASANTLKATRPINALSADGSTVAVHYARGNIPWDQPQDYRCLDAWNPSSGTLSRIPVTDCEKSNSCCSLGAGGFVDLTYAGGRVAWSRYVHFAGLDIFDLFTATLDRAGPVLVPGVCPDNRFGDCLFPEVDLQGDGSLLVFDTWDPACPYPSFPLPCSTAPKRNGRLWRFDGDHAALISSSTSALTPLAVDSGRVLVDHQDGVLDVVRTDGSSLRTFHYDTGNFRGAQLQGNDVAVLEQARIVDYDLNSGTRLHDWPVGCGDARLADLEDGVLVYICGTYVHLVWLGDGKDVALTPAGDDPHAQLEAAGLYYAYRVSDTSFPGRVEFIPFADLPRG